MNKLLIAIAAAGLLFATGYTVNHGLAGGGDGGSGPPRGSQGKDQPGGRSGGQVPIVVEGYCNVCDPDENNGGSGAYSGGGIGSNNATGGPGYGTPR